MSNVSSEVLKTADLSQLYWFEAGPITVHNEWATIASEERKKSKKSLPLLRLLFTNPNMDLSLESAYKLDKDNFYMWQFSGKLGFGTDVKNVDQNKYFKLYQEKLEPYDLSLGNALYSNARFVKNTQRALGMLSVFDDRLAYTNGATWTGVSGWLKNVSLNMKAPLLKELREEPGQEYGYFKDSIRAQILAAVALAECVTGTAAATSESILIAGVAGKTYRYDEGAAIAELLTERISLRGVSSEKDEVAGPSVNESEAEDIFSITPEKKTTVGIDDIAGPEFVREKLLELVLAQRDPQALEKWGVNKPQGLLLYGPAGTGKSMAAEALANELEAEFWEIKASDITDKWLGNTEKNMQALFDRAKGTTKPTVMFWDEIDSLVGKTDGEASAARALEAARGIFKREVAKLSDTAPNIVLVGATNHHEDMDDALVRAGRFDMKIYMGLPDKSTRIQLFANRIASIMHHHETQDKKLYGTDLNIDRLAEVTDGWSGAEIVEILRRSQMKKALDEIRGRETTPISQNDIEIEIRLFRHER